jgi:hypothetical protein
MSKVDIKGINKVDLLKALWKNSKPASFFMFSNTDPPEFDNENAEKSVSKSIDYYSGRCIKCDLSKDEVDPTQYDREYGEGCFQTIVDKIKNPFN